MANQTTASWKPTSRGVILALSLTVLVWGLLRGWLPKQITHTMHLAPMASRQVYAFTKAFLQKVFKLSPDAMAFAARRL